LYAFLLAPLTCEVLCLAHVTKQPWGQAGDDFEKAKQTATRRAWLPLPRDHNYVLCMAPRSAPADVTSMIRFMHRKHKTDRF